MLDVTETDLARESLSNYAYGTFMKKEPLINALRETRPDMWLSYVAYLFDLNFSASFVWIRESGYMEKILPTVCSNRSGRSETLAEDF